MPNVAKSVRRLVGYATILVVATGACAHAEAGKTTWTGYLYQGPGFGYAVVDELAQAASLDVIGCANDWCEVKVGRSVGYVLAEIVARTRLDTPPPPVLAQPAAALTPASPPGPCFEANQTGGNGGNAKTVFCGK